MSFMKHQKTLNGHKMVWFDAVSLYTSVPLNNTIETILRRTYENSEINFSITKK